MHDAIYFIEEATGSISPSWKRKWITNDGDRTRRGICKKTQQSGTIARYEHFIEKINRIHYLNDDVFRHIRPAVAKNDVVGNADLVLAMYMKLTQFHNIFYLYFWTILIGLHYFHVLHFTITFGSMMLFMIIFSISLMMEHFLLFSSRH